MSTIAAISTPQATGGVAMIRVSGDKALEVADRVFRPLSRKEKPSEMEGYTAAFGKIYDSDLCQLDSGVLVVYRAPRSYTGEDVAEITCHGGVFISRRVLRACLDAGAIMAQPGEFTRRALLSGKMTITQAEAVVDLINSKSDQYLRCAISQQEGALFQKIQRIKKCITDITVQIAAWIDYPDEMLDSFEISSQIGQLTDCRLQLNLLLKSYDVGRIMREGIPTAIAGKPNVGKSTLMNLLAGCERSIVTDVAGTTRDVVEETVMLGGILLRLSDCAGLRETNDPVESIGVKLAQKELDKAELVLAVFDNSRKLEKEDYWLIGKLRGKQAICVINKTDLTPELDMAYLATQFGTVTEISATDSSSIEKLDKALNKLLKPEQLDMSAGFLANERQRECVKKAEAALDAAISGVGAGVTLDAVGIMLEQTLRALAELTGENVSDTVIDEIFKRFCVGK